MTGELGHEKIDGLKLWNRFVQEITSRYASHAEDREALQKMKEAKYEGKMSTFLLEMENLNIKVQMRGVTWRREIESKLPFKLLERMSMEKFDLDTRGVFAARGIDRRDDDRGNIVVDLIGRHHDARAGLAAGPQTYR